MAPGSSSHARNLPTGLCPGTSKCLFNQQRSSLSLSTSSFTPSSPYVSVPWESFPHNRWLFSCRVGHVSSFENSFVRCSIATLQWDSLRRERRGTSQTTSPPCTPASPHVPFLLVHSSSLTPLTTRACEASFFRKLRKSFTSRAPWNQRQRINENDWPGAGLVERL